MFLLLSFAIQSYFSLDDYWMDHVQIVIAGIDVTLELYGLYRLFVV